MAKTSSAKSSKTLSVEERKELLDKRLSSMGVLSQIQRGAEINTPVEFIPCGIEEITKILGPVSGFATGNLIEFIGESGSGKTYVAIKAAAEAQKRGRKKVAWFNVENSFYAPRAAELGLIVDDPELFELIPNLGSGELVCEVVYEMVQSELYELIVVDSITALIPNDAFEKTFNDPAKIGAHATLIGAFGKKLTYACAKYNTSVIAINQFRMGSGGGNMNLVKKGTGGEALYFYDHYRLVFKKITGENGKVFNSEKKIIGGLSEVSIPKNRYNEPNLSTQFPIYYTKEEMNILVGWIMKAKAPFVELIKESGPKNNKIFQYIDDNGEIHESPNIKTFIEILKDLPTKPSRVKNPPANIFEFICRKIKFTTDMVDKLNKQLESNNITIELPNELIGYEEVEDGVEYDDAN